MKKITPMARLKDHFKRFDKNVASITSYFDLSKSKPKYNPYPDFDNVSSSHTYSEKDYYSKGVKSDFIKIYKLNGTKDSFAFAFDNIDSDISKNLIAVTIKLTDKDIISVVCSFKEFKTKIKSLNGFLEVLNSMKQLNTTSLLATLDKTFGIKSPEQTADDISLEVKERVSKEVTALKKEVTVKKRSLTSSNKKLATILEKYNEVVEATKKTTDFYKKEKAFLKAQKTYLHAKSRVELDSASDKRELDSIKHMVDRINSEINTLNRNIRSIIDTATQSYSPLIRSTVKKLFKIKD